LFSSEIPPLYAWRLGNCKKNALIITGIIYTGLSVLEIGLPIIMPSKSITTKHRYSCRILQKFVKLCPLFPPYSDLDLRDSQPDGNVHLVP
jgi:hypothetical protein